MASKHAILVTGSHRSGTTWVGRTIAASSAVVYFHEPFNRDRPLAERWVPAPYAFTYICAQNEGPYYDPIRRILEWHFNPNGGAAVPGNVAARLRRRFKLIQYRLAGTRALIKDPLAVLSAPWLATRFDMRVVVMIRHPAAFVSSVKLFNWKHPFSDFLNQPLLMKDYLQPFATQIKEYVEVEHDVIDQGAFLWKLIHSVIGKYVEQFPDWIFVRHEDISRDPLGRYHEYSTSSSSSFLRRWSITFAPTACRLIRSIIAG